MDCWSVGSGASRVQRENRSEQAVPWGLTGKLLSDHHLRLPSTCSLLRAGEGGSEHHRSEPSVSLLTILCWSSSWRVQGSQRRSFGSLSVIYSVPYSEARWKYLIYNAPFFSYNNFTTNESFTARKNEVTKNLRNLPKITQLVSSRNTDLNLGLSHSKLHLAVCFLNQLDRGDSCTTLWIH